MNIVTYDQRLAKMKVPGDEQKQIELAKNYVKSLRAKKRKAPTLAEKIDIDAAIKEANGVLRKLRLNVFDLEDMLRNKGEGSDQLPASKSDLLLRGMS